jgi:hypothetical protein
LKARSRCAIVRLYGTRPSALRARFQRLCHRGPGPAAAQGDVLSAPGPRVWVLSPAAATLRPRMRL